jgi:hypothetical protein
MEKITILEAKSISIVTLLSKWGFNPDKIKGHDYWYKSIFRKENTASLKVNTAKNVFIDFGDPRYKGTIIDLGIMYRNCSIREFLNELGNYFLFHPLVNSTYSKNQNSRRPQIENPAKIEIKNVRNLGYNRAIIDYLFSRKLDIQRACKYLKEIYYRVGQKNYFSLGFKNNSGGWETRNVFFKGCIGPKDVTTLTSTQNLISVFEGFFDFLSAQKLGLVSLDKTDILVLNSNSLLDRAVAILGKYEEVNLFLDNDPSGAEATRKIIEVVFRAKDLRHLYPDCKDLNDFLASKDGEIKKLELTSPQVYNYSGASHVFPMVNRLAPRRGGLKN